MEDALLVEAEPSAIPITAIDGKEIDAIDAEGADAKIEKQKKRKRSTAWVLRNAGEALRTIHHDSVEPIASEVTWKHGSGGELLCSYNWQESADGANNIFVPGQPPKWTPRTLPITLTMDSGFHCMDHNHVRQPRYPWDPMFRAFEVMNADISLSSIDVVADRNNLRTLLEFIQGKSVGPFRLDLHLVNNTLIIVRKEDRFWRHMNGGQSHGHTFERNFTRAAPGMEDSTSHYRVIRYRMGSLNVAVRAEVDAYYEAPTSTEGFPAVDDLPSISCGGPAERPTLNFKTAVRTIHKGRAVPFATMAELKTQSRKPGEYPRPVKCMDQLWFGRTTHLLTGQYEVGTGVFKKVVHHNVRESIADWETRNQESLRKLVRLLIDLRNIVRHEPGPVRTAVLVREHKDGPIEVHTMERKDRIVQPEFFWKYWGRRQPQSRPPASSSRGYHNSGDVRNPAARRTYLG